MNVADQYFGADRQTARENGTCMPPPIGCGKKILEGEFRDERSLEEYRITLLCQACQDSLGLG